MCDCDAGVSTRTGTALAPGACDGDETRLCSCMKVYASRALFCMQRFAHFLVLRKYISVLVLCDMASFFSLIGAAVCSSPFRCVDE